MNLGENIYRLRTARNLSQGALADALDVSRQSVSKWENNSATPELDKLIKMSDLFGVTVDELLGRKNEEQEQKPVRSTHTFLNMPPRVTAAAVLLLFATTVFAVVCATKNPFVALLLAAPFLICAVVCFFCKRNIGIISIWAIYLYLTFAPLGVVQTAYELYFDNQYDAYMKFTLTIQFLALVGSVLLTFRQSVTLEKRHKLLFAAGWLIWIPYFIARVLLYIKCATELGSVFPFDLADDPGFPLFVFLVTVVVRILYQRRSSHESR